MVFSWLKCFDPPLSILTPQNWHHFEDLKTPLCNTGSNPSIGGSHLILRTFFFFWGGGGGGVFFCMVLLFFATWKVESDVFVGGQGSTVFLQIKVTPQT